MDIHRYSELNQNFCKEYVKPTFSLGTIVPWWKELLLWFLPTHVAFDYGFDEGNVAVFYKHFRGVIYIVGHERLPKLDNIK